MFTVRRAINVRSSAKRLNNYQSVFGRLRSTLAGNSWLLLLLFSIYWQCDMWNWFWEFLAFVQEKLKGCTRYCSAERLFQAHQLTPKRLLRIGIGYSEPLSFVTHLAECCTLQSSLFDARALLLLFQSAQCRYIRSTNTIVIPLVYAAVIVLVCSTKKKWSINVRWFLLPFEMVYECIARHACDSVQMYLCSETEREE